MTPQQQQQRQSRVVWFEIPAADMDRACRFYETILATNLIRAQFGPDPIAVFPYQEPAIGGCIMQGESLHARADGTLIYLNADPSLDETLARVVPAGGKIVLPKTALPPDMGFFARVQDTEGNTIGLHAVS